MYKFYKVSEKVVESQEHKFQAYKEWQWTSEFHVTAYGSALTLETLCWIAVLAGYARACLRGNERNKNQEI